MVKHEISERDVVVQFPHIPFSHIKPCSLDSSIISVARSLNSSELERLLSQNSSEGRVALLESSSLLEGGVLRAAESFHSKKSE